MSNPIANLISQAEASLSDMGRRAVESVTVPLRTKSQELVTEVTTTIKATVVSIVAKAGLALFAAVMAIIALSYALSALHTYLSEQFGPVEATLIMAGTFLLLAVIAIAVMMMWPAGTAKTSPGKAAQVAARDVDAALAKTRRDAEAVKRTAQAKASSAMPRDAPAVDVQSPLLDMKSGLGAIASALGEAGLKREQAGLRAGLAIAEQLTPMQLVSLVLLGGFVAGFRRRRR